MLIESSRFSDLSSPLDSETSRTLLLIDDDRVSRERLARALERKGFTVHATDSVREGIAIARNSAMATASISSRISCRLVPILESSCSRPTAISRQPSRRSKRALSIICRNRPIPMRSRTPCSRMDRRFCRPPRKIRCRPIVYVGSISNACSIRMTATSPKQHDVCVCIAARCNAF
jgi:CheY-like chemotaxis protein